MKDYIADRVRAIAEYIVETGSTVRDAAQVFKISKSTVHKDMSQRLPEISPALANEVKRIMEINKAERHIRGGLATQNKYRSEHDCKESVADAV